VKCDIESMFVSIQFPDQGVRSASARGIALVINSINSTQFITSMQPDTMYIILTLNRMILQFVRFYLCLIHGLYFSVNHSGF